MISELSVSCSLSQKFYAKNPKDSWSDHKAIAIPAVDRTEFVNTEKMPGAGEHFEPQTQPFSGQETFEWPCYNDRVYVPDGTFRPAFVCHMRTKIKYSNDKMFYIASFIRGMTIDEALKQLKFLPLKGARAVEEVLKEAQEMAVREHHFEYPTNMWVAESFSENFDNVRGFRRHGRGKIAVIKYRYISYFCRLEEGEPPADYYGNAPLSNHQWLEKYIQDHRSKFIHSW